MADQELNSIDAIARELSHRTANILQIAITALQLGRQGRSDVVGSALEQLSASAEVNRLLTPTGGDPVDLVDQMVKVCAATGRSLRSGDGVELIIDSPKLIASADKARRLSMIAAELVSNSVRHAFRDGEGSILLAIRDDGVNTGLLVEDDGCCHGWTRSAGQGRGIVDALAASMGGSVRRSLSAKGALRVEVLVPTLAAAMSVPAGNA